MVFRLRWHECWCPDEFLRRAFHVAYCPKHGHRDRAEAEFETPLTTCGCRDCGDNEAQYLWEREQNITHLRDFSFI